jgi:hypothetical protein
VRWGRWNVHVYIYTLDDFVAKMNITMRPNDVGPIPPNVCMVHISGTILTE